MTFFADCFIFVFIFRDEWECRREYRDKIDWCFSWLYTPREDGRPRMLISDYHSIHVDAFPSIIERFKEVIYSLNI
jgi:hypothetical protein